MRAAESPFGLLDDFPDPAFVVDRGGAVVYASLAAEEALGRPGALVGRELSSLLDERDRPALRRMLGALAERGTAERVEVRLDRSGNPGELASDARRWSFAGRKLVRGEKTLFLISAHAAGNEEERYRKIVESTRDGIWLIDAHRRTIFANEPLARMLGYSVAEMIGRMPTEFMAEGVREEATRRFERRRRGISEVYDFCFRHKNGGEVWAVVSANPLQDDSGGFGGALVVVTDVSDRHRLEEELLHAQKMEAVGRLAGGIAHEFNNLLTSIIGAAELLSYRLAGTPDAGTELHSIRTASDRAASLVRRLLTFARRQNAHPRVVALRAVVEGAERILASAVGEDAELEIFNAPEDCWARVDPAQIEQALLNLVINARDAMPDGGRIEVALSRARLDEAVADLPPGDYVRLTVSDTGSGMSREVQGRIFEPFFTTKGREHGSGLGLSIVYGIIKQNGGHISVSSAPGSGSTFTIHLPHGEPVPADEPEPEESPVPRGTETILVVEDDELVRGITVRALRALGYRILLAEDGADALQVVERNGGSVDLVLTDVVMPRMGGPELVEKLSAKLPDLRVLFVSGYSEESLADRGILTERRAFLDKPFTSAVLARRIREILDLGRGDR